MKSLKKTTPSAPAGAQSGRIALALAVAWVLGLALLLRVGLPVWTAMAPAPAMEAATAVADHAAASHEPNLAALQSLALFGGAAAANTPATPALNTALNLRLEGVMLAGDRSNSTAVIVSGEQRGSYRAGDTLPAGTNIKVDSIDRDHVVIDNRGQREVLWLYAGAAAATLPATGTASIPGLVLPPGTDQRVLKTAARLVEIISVAPAHENGQLIGYRLTPGARLKEFVQLGFETNDIVVAANGIALNDVTNLPKLYSLMDGATEVSFSLLRNGVALNRHVTLTPEMTGN